MTNKNYSESTIRVGTFFSGIGAPEKAFQKLKEEKIIKDYRIEFFSEIDKNAIKSYCAVHNVDESLNLGSITEIKGNELPYCDIWIGGFPCQDISCAGKMKGFDLKSATRSSLGWEMIRLLREVKNKPKYVVFENVENITSKPFRETLSLFKQDLINLGYTLYDKVLDATKYDMPQTRKRYFLVAILGNKKVFTFADGNGRVGRIIMFKECLINNIMPFIILDDDKTYYMRGLKEYENDKMFLIDTIGHEQDLYEKMCEKLLNFEIEE